MKKILYFVPHQDDELLGFGLDIANETEINSENVYVYLCTDGSSSGVRRMLNNKEKCHYHEGVHNFELSREEFSKARDKEFILSLKALGVKEGNVTIYSDREVDGSLRKEYALKKMREEIKNSNPEDEISIRTYAPYRKVFQQTDHSLLGLAALELYENGEVNDIKLIVENPDLKFSISDFPEIKFTKESYNSITKEKVIKACESYKIWDPENGLYAIGIHSVYNEFVNILTYPDTYSIIKSK